MTADWISVRDRLPDSDTTVLVHCPKESELVWLGYEEDGKWWTPDHQSIRVTHWAELPAPPAGKGTK